MFKPEESWQFLIMTTDIKVLLLEGRSRSHPREGMAGGKKLHATHGNRCSAHPDDNITVGRMLYVH